MADKERENIKLDKEMRPLESNAKKAFFRAVSAKILILPGFIFFLLFQPYVGCAETEAVPSALLKWSGRGTSYAVIVDKSDQKIFLYHGDDISRPLKIYRCSTGEKSGAKARINDRRTPEGVYFFTKSYVKKDLSPIYGVRAFPIDYPNPFDRKNGNGGYGIWFHGTNKPLKPRDTNGCIVLENSSIDDLASYIELNRTPAIIIPKIELIPGEEVKQRSKKLEDLIEKWRSSWEKKLWTST